MGEQGRIIGLETIDVKSVFDDDHRFNPTFLPGTEQVLAADTVILAVGQAADLAAIEGVDLELHQGSDAHRSCDATDVTRADLGRR